MSQATSQEMTTVIHPMAKEVPPPLALAPVAGVAVGPVGTQKVELQILMQAISCCAGPLVNQLLGQYPDLLNMKGWNGLTPLHKACLGGDYNVTQLLLSLGADPNMQNDQGETSLHYACRRGNSAVVHMFVQYGGNLKVIDNHGRGMMHHTAQTGSVYVMHYLHTVHGMSCDEVEEESKRTPLHIVCEHGHVEMFRYLLKNDRCNIRRVDKHGDTALHLASRYGHSVICWTLVNILGAQAVREQNKDGYNPVDLVFQQSKTGHKAIQTVYKDLEKSSVAKIKGPVALWYWQLLMPCLIYVCSAALAKIICGSSHQSTLGFIIMVILLRILMRQGHRIDHIARWANPVFVGMFAAGMFHTFIVYYSVVFPFLLYTQTSTSLLALLGVSVLLTPVTLYMFWRALTQDPGIISTSEFNYETNQPKTIVDLCVPFQKAEQFCTTCEIVCPEKTKHCKLCNKCYYNMDHHCLFLMKCIANNNHFLFVWFILLDLLSMVIFLTAAVNYSLYKYPELYMKDLFLRLYHENYWLLSLMLMNIASIVWGINLLRYQFYNIGKGHTAYFVPVGFNRLSSKQRFMNCVYFLRGKGLQVQESQPL